MVTRTIQGYGVNATNIGILPPPILAKTSPATSNLYYPIGQLWLNQSTQVMYIYVGQGLWPQLASGIAGNIDEIATSSGNALPMAGVVTIVGTANQITTSATGSTVTLAFSGPYTPATYTAHGVLLGEGTSSIVATAVGATGTVLTGNTGADPTWQAIGSGSGLTTNGVVLGGASGFTSTVALVAGQTIIASTTGAAPSPTYISSSKVTYAPSFNAIPVMSASTGGVAAVTVNTTNVWAYPQWGAYFEQYNTVATSIIAPTLSTTAGRGLNIGSLTGANAKIIEITEGNSVNSKNAFITGTSPAFYVQASFNIAVLNTAQNLAIGFRAVQAYQGTSLVTYTDYALLGVLGTAGEIESQTQKATGGEVDTDSTSAVTAATTFTFRVNVSSAGAVTYTVNGTPNAILNAVSYTFTASTTVIPFIYLAEASGAHGECDLISYQCGFQ